MQIHAQKRSLNIGNASKWAAARTAAIMHSSDRYVDVSDLRRAMVNSCAVDAPSPAD
ncbi:hypothetical protein OKW40_004058 [Paraburkholderia sp. RAU6.4a]|uniref:hypothetical protein n=1 Tax=Paraburkholderia sp. RAU6.4a TaxID=2991067 RepID=UPI003D19588F